MPYFVYVLRNAEGRIYVGQTSDLERRLEEHRNGMSRWTANRGPWTLIASGPSQAEHRALA